MMTGSLTELADALGWRLLGPDAAFHGVAIDHRLVQPGQLFVALRGARHDGHDYVADALARGASAALVGHAVAGARPLLLAGETVAGDTQLALGRLAARHRASWRGKMFAVTGSAGKTTTKEMLAAILAQAGAVHATRGNLNNEIGVPLTLLGLGAAHQFAVLELGAAKPHDIAYLVELVRPEVSLLTNAMPAHLQGFGSLDQVAQTKGEIVVPEAGHVAVINSDDPYAGVWRQRAGAARVMAFSASGRDTAAVRATAVELLPAGSRFTLHGPLAYCTVELGVPGAHNVANALAAAAAALAAGLSLAQVKEGLERFGGVAGRMQLSLGPHGLRLIDDTYNANPQAVRSAIDVLARQPEPRVLILGDMAELGEQRERLHRELGDYARRAGIESLIGVGPLASSAARAFGDGGHSFPAKAQLLEWLADGTPLRDFRACLVKGSRGAGMEQVVAHLLAAASTEEGQVKELPAVAAAACRGEH